jgi:hypothetical protein
MKKVFWLLIPYLVLIASPSVAQQESVQNSLLNALTGKWVLQGTIDGQKTTHDLDVEWVLGNQYVEMTEVSREKDAAGHPSYSAKVFITWNNTSKLFDCLWLDNTGNGGLKDGAAGHSDYIADRFNFVFKYSGGGKFHTTFLYDKAGDRWQWMMDDEENGKMSAFARLMMTRSKN